MRVTSIALLTLLILSLVSCLKIANVDRTLDLSTQVFTHRTFFTHRFQSFNFQIVKGTATVTFENDGASSVSDVLFALSDKEAENLAYIAASENGKKDGKLKVCSSVFKMFVCEKSLL